MRTFFETDSAGDVLLEVKVVPRASADRIEGLEGHQLKVRITAPPVQGKANDRLLRFLADFLLLRRSQISLAAGKGSRLKRVRVTGLTPDTRSALISRLAGIPDRSGSRCSRG